MDVMITPWNYYKHNHKSFWTATIKLYTQGAENVSCIDTMLP